MVHQIHGKSEIVLDLHPACDRPIALCSFRPTFAGELVVPEFVVDDQGTNGVTNGMAKTRRFLKTMTTHPPVQCNGGSGHAHNDLPHLIRTKALICSLQVTGQDLRNTIQT